LTEFGDEILQNQYDPLMKKDEYTIIYKQSSSHGTRTMLLDEKDWKNFYQITKKFCLQEKT
jgi:hypothetical protein